MKRAFLVHGWGGSPNNDWLPWATTQLKQKGYEVIVPFMPDTNTPKILPWVSKLQELVEKPETTDIFIGHSIGCQTILRFLEDLNEDAMVDSVTLVAPWFTLTNLEGEASWQIAKPWIETPMDFPKIVSKARLFTAIFSDNDSWVPLDENLNKFKEKLNPKIIVLHTKGHFTEDEGIRELPEIFTYQ